MKSVSILLMIIALGVVTQAQEPVGNDDRGRAVIIQREGALVSNSNLAGKTVVAEPQQYSIFLGRGWAVPAMRVREAELSNLLANVRDQSTLRNLSELGVKNLYGPTGSREQLDELSGNISDLQIQAVLDRMIKDQSLLTSNSNTIYVIFLDPNMKSTLGNLFAGKHYAAYHTFFNAAGSKLKYVVVSFEPDRKLAVQIALRALVSAAVNNGG